MGRRRVSGWRPWLSVVILVCVTVGHAAMAQPLSSSGIVLMHGKAGNTKWIDSLAEALGQSGVTVETPLMPWSRARIYDRSYAGAMKEIDAAVERLRAKGATRIFIGGHSLGANAALGYGARRKGLAGIVVMAPGHLPGTPNFQNWVRSSVIEARRMVAAGRGDARMEGDDVAGGHRLRVRVSADVYLSWFVETGPANMANNARRLTPETPLLWVVGDADSINFGIAKEIAYDRLPPNPLTRFVTVAANHYQVPTRAFAEIRAWMRLVLAKDGALP